MKKVLAIIGGIVVVVLLGYMIFVLPGKKDCAAQARAAYQQATTNYQEGLISSSTYEEAGKILQTQLMACVHSLG